ncbi:hypothetical protein J3A65_000999 [Rhizobium sp. PvP014]|nr:hypothetical protein [Rhizobium sp. PvP014]MBP2527632.1 hypothetical protein [Rhizobium sp. PvP099]
MISFSTASQADASSLRRIPCNLADRVRVEIHTVCIFENGLTVLDNVSETDQRTLSRQSPYPSPRSG